MPPRDIPIPHERIYIFVIHLLHLLYLKIIFFSAKVQVHGALRSGVEKRKPAAKEYKFPLSSSTEFNNFNSDELGDEDGRDDFVNTLYSANLIICSDENLILAALDFYLQNCRLLNTIFQVQYLTRYLKANKKKLPQSSVLMFCKLTLSDTLFINFKWGMRLDAPLDSAEAVFQETNFAKCLISMYFHPTGPFIVIHVQEPVAQ